MRTRLSLATLLVVLLASNAFLPQICAAHCSPAKATSPTHHHEAPAQQEKHPAMCADCSQNSPQLHAFTCPSATQIDARTKPSFALTTRQTAANSVVQKNASAGTHEFFGPKTFSQYQATLSPQHFVTSAAPLRL